MPGSAIERLLALRRSIRDFNSARGLHTALLYTGGWFVQWHEGPAEAVERTWAISRSHDGHCHYRVVHRSTGPGTLREPIDIAALVGADKPTDVAARLFELEREQRERPLEPLQVWRRLAVPAGGGFARGGGEPHRAIAVTSEHTEAIELVRALADRLRLPVSYQRLAGPNPHAPDAGGAYVDIPARRLRTRVHALSRHVLGLEMTRLSFSRLDALVLLTGQRAEGALALRAGVTPFLRAFSPEPALHVAGLDGRPAQATLMDLVERLQPEAG